MNMNTSDVLALKYRPKTLANVIGQDAVVQTLTNAFTSGKMYQTLVFAGNYGNGKTSCARIVAAMDNCEKGPGLNPCGQCKNCSDIFEGRSIDVREMNAAKSRGIDDIREIADFVSVRPLSSRFKYVLVDECLDYHSRVDTENGRIEIGKIVNEKRQLHVKSFNKETGHIEYRPITGWFKNGGKQVYRLKFETLGTLLASSNHLISTPDGYKAVADLSVGDVVHRRGFDFDNKETICEQKILLKEDIGFKEFTYDIGVEQNHNYFASGTLVHNCHRLTPDAAESALKLFEEPPANVRFICATTDLHRMKVTLQSRAMTFRFIKVPWTVLTEHLKNISTKENYDVEESALKIAARLADGSVRNALRNLQLLHTYAGTRKMTVDLAQQSLGAIDDNQFFTFIDAIIAKDAATSMKIVNTILGKGVEFEQIFNGLLEHLRTLLVVMTCHNTATLVYLSEEEKKGYIHQIGNIDKKLSITNTEDKQRSVTVVSTMISLLCGVARSVALSINPQTLLEQYAVESIMAFGRIEREGKVKST